MCNEHVLDVGALSPKLAIEIIPTRCDSALLYNNEHRKKSLSWIGRKFVSVPAKVWLPSIAIDRTQHTASRSHPQVMLIVMPGKSGMIRLYVDLEILLEAILVKKADN